MLVSTVLALILNSLYFQIISWNLSTATGSHWPASSLSYTHVTFWCGRKDPQSISKWVYSSPQEILTWCIWNITRNTWKTADLFTIIPSLLILGPPAFFLLFTSAIHLFNAPLLLLLAATLLTLLLPPHLSFTSLLLWGSTHTQKKSKFHNKNMIFSNLIFLFANVILKTTKKKSFYLFQPPPLLLLLLNAFLPLGQ